MIFMLKKLLYYFRVWLRLTVFSFQIAFMASLGAVIFTVGKLLRFGLFIIILFVILTKTKVLAGYTFNQTLIFFMTFNVVDTLTQLLFREVYRFRPKIVSGDFDLTLAKPLNPLFQTLLGGADFLDLLTLVPFFAILVILISHIQLSAWQIVIYLLLTANALVIAAGFHIVVLALGILTTEVDHTIMIYRDISGMVRFPVDIYQRPLREVITFIIPVGIMMTIPVKVLFGLLSIKIYMIAGIIGVVWLFGSLVLWKFALTQYASASS